MNICHLFILILVNIGLAGFSWTIGWKVLVVVVVVIVADGDEPTPVLETCPTSDECALNVWFRSNDALLFKSWSISVEGNI